MNKGYSLGFLIVLLVIVLGLYVAITGFMSSREAQQAQSAASASTEAARPSSTPSRPAPTPTETAIVIPSPVAGITTTMTAVVSTEAPPPTEPPAPTEAPPVQPTSTSVVLPSPTPVPVPVPAYMFRLAGPPGPDPNYQFCCYVHGTIKDAAGNGLEGVQVQAFNEWTTKPALTKGGAELGIYDIPVEHEVVITWYVVIVDQAGTQISPQVQIQWNPDEANGFRIDWQRTY